MTTPTLPHRTLSKSDFKLASGCTAKLFFREHGYQTTADSPYVRLLAEGAYMVEALANATFPDGIFASTERDPQRAFSDTLAHLDADEVTLFQPTFRWGRRLVRADILCKRGSVIRLIEVKAKSFDGAAHAAGIAAGGNGEFRGKRKPFGISSEWIEKIEEVAFQTIVIERVLPGLTVEPRLMLVDKSKRCSIDHAPRLFEIRRDGRDIGVQFTGTVDQLAGLDLLTDVDVSAEVAMVRDEVDARASRYESMLDGPITAATAPLSAGCKDCEFKLDPGQQASGFHECWGTLADVRPHVLDLYHVSTVSDATGVPIVESLTRSGTASMLDVPESVLVKKDGTVGSQAERQRRQIRLTRSGETWVAPTLGPKLAALEYPLHFIDFESSRLALPYHANMRAYGQVAFQWSCHTVDAPGAAPRHSEWLNADAEWPNMTFATQLRSAVGDQARVLTWSSFERAQLNELAREHPHIVRRDESLIEWVGAIGSRIFDMHKCADTEFYHPAMGGRTSIKVVLDALWKSDPTMRDQFKAWTGRDVPATIDPYHALDAIVIDGDEQDVRDGTGAMRAYEAMMYGVEKDDAEAKAKWRSLLLEYCKLDTLSMVLIFEHWRRITA